MEIKAYSESISLSKEISTVMNNKILKLENLNMDIFFFKNKYDYLINNGKLGTT